MYSHDIPLLVSLPRIFPPWWSPCQASRRAPPAPGSALPPSPGAWRPWRPDTPRTTSEDADLVFPRSWRHFEVLKTRGSRGFSPGSPFWVTKLLDSWTRLQRLVSKLNVVCRPPVQFYHLGTMKPRPHDMSIAFNSLFSTRTSREGP